MFTKYFTCNTKQKTDHEASQDNKSTREELGDWKGEINWNKMFYGSEHATNFTDILNKTLQEVP